MVTLDEERARAGADTADAALARGDVLGPLHGLAMTIKDAIETEGIRSTGGAVELLDHVPTEDAPAVARLEEAGAIVFGNTKLPRWSGGAAAALGAGLTGAELGVDIGGSVRLPAHCCGVYGIEPSYGVVPNLGYLDHVGGVTTRTDINTSGPMGRSAADLDLLLSVVMGPTPVDASA